MSYVLNRIFTEWYRSQGYPFQITSSPAYDQYYVHDAGIFDTVSVLVDELFDQYISRPNDFAPIYSEYCDGVIATCDGMTQWGTVSLARQGMDALEILRYYYGQNIELRTAEVVEVIPDSYPGELSEGSAGADVTARADLSAYSDAGQIPSWAMDAMQWANARRLIVGRDSSHLAPNGGTTRAEMAAILSAYIGK